MSASSSGSSGSTALGSMRISTISPPPLALTATMPPPEVASTISFRASLLRGHHLLLHLLRLLQHRVHVELGHQCSSTSWASKVSLSSEITSSSESGSSSSVPVARPPAPRRRSRSRACGRSPRRARRGASRCSSGPRPGARWKSASGGNSIVSVSSSSPTGCASTSSVAIGIERDRTDSSTPRCHASWSCASSSGGKLRRRRRSSPLRRVAAGGRLGAGAGPAAGAGWGEVRPRLRGRWPGMGSLLEQLHAVGERLAGEVGVRAGHLHESELERQAGVAALPHVVDGDGEQVDQPQRPWARAAGSPVRAAAPATRRSAAASRARGRGAARAGGGAGARARR